MADLTFKASLEDGISPELKKIQAQVKTTQDSFNAFKGTLTGLASAAFVASSIQMAAALDDVATASGIALDKVIGFGRAIAANGGTVDGANTGIARFANFIEAAASGSADAQNKFSELGITFKDLQTLSEADLLRKTIDGLARVEDNAKRTALGMQIFGKSFNSVDFKGVNAGLDQFIAKAGPSASAVKSAADAEENFASAIKNLQIELLSAIKPISNLAKTITDAGDAFSNFIKAIVQIGLVVATFTILGRAVTLLRGAAVALAAGWDAVATGVGTVVNAFRNWGAITANLNQLGGVFTGTLKVLQGYIGNLGTWAFSSIPGLGALALGLTYVTDWAEKAARAIGLLDSKKDPREGMRGRGDPQEIANREKYEKEKIIRQVALNAEIAKEKKAATDALQSYQQQNKELNAKFALQTRTMGMSEEQRLVEEENAAAQERYLKAVEPLRNRILEIQAKGADATAGEISAISELQDGIAKITQEYTNQEPVRNNLLKNRIDELLKTKELAYQAELLTKAEERRLAVSDQVRETLLRGPEEAQKAYEEMQLSGMTGVAKKLREIEIEENRLKKASLERIAAQFSNADGDMVDAQGFTRAVNEIEAATKRNIDIRQAAARNIGTEQRSFADGWKKAFADYRDSATNAANQAGRVFNKVTSGMEDALVNFVKTGKFEWKQLTASILEELLRGQIQKGIASILGPLTELMGIDLGSIGGGNPGGSPTNPMWTKEVGGNNSIGGGYGNMAGSGSTTGGGFFDSIKNVFSGITDTVGNVFSSIGNTVSNVFSGITDIFSGGGGGGGGFFSGLSDLFGGFFANGGMLGAGKFGIAGENGPELISGPASVAPIGGVTNVTYNINAVDAQSFKAMIAADPGFIHAVAMQGGKSMPRRY